LSSDDPHAYYKQQYLAVIDAISGELSSRFSQSAMKKLEFIETILLDAANDMLQNLSMAWGNGPTAICLYDSIINFQKLDS